MRKVLGVDPGLGATGYAVVAEVDGGFRLVAQGTVYTKKGDPLPERLAQIYEELAKVVENWDPEGLALEEVYLGKNAPAAMFTVEVCGVVLLFGRGRKIFTYSPREVKRRICGTGSAPKEQMMGMIAHLLGEAPRSDHAADAAALALCALLEEGG
ncbi:MAG: crossover junction endodeoxyribonuclease RuvC [Candidatus Bipolaricaulaceae bacterium]